MKKYLVSGAIVRAIAGRESGEVFLILNVDGDYAYITNGKSRPISNPKKKNLKHLYLLCKSESVELDKTNLTDDKISNYLENYNKFRQ